MASRTGGVWFCLVLASLGLPGVGARQAQAAAKIRVLFVGGDWKSQLPNYRGTMPLRGHFIRRGADPNSSATPLLA
jgi:hypothetical protein